ncbi:hypothetical protein JTB14_025146 [Gonioctena quinquepunctata]|nr:hypothetical protein JTB14_025146 [Gonioctena quinquepunctata]
MDEPAFYLNPSGGYVLAGKGKSKNGWMIAETFYEYFADIFHPFFVEKDYELPVIVFSDDHTSHLRLPLSEFCREHQIIVGKFKTSNNQLKKQLNEIDEAQTMEATSTDQNQNGDNDGITSNIVRTEASEQILSVLLNKSRDNLDDARPNDTTINKCQSNWGDQRPNGN